MNTKIIYSKIFDNHNNPGHPENATRTTLMLDALKQSELIDQVDISEPTLLSEQNLYKIHTAEMITQIKAMSRLPEGWIDLDTYVCKNDFETARLAAGGMVRLANDVMKEKVKNGFALVRPPGHHATKTRSMGFCLFNNISLAAYDLMKKGKRVLIFDPDVHHGNGTQEIFYGSDKILFQSFHLSPHFPGTGPIEEIGEKNGEGYTMNAPFPRGTGETTIQRLLDEIFKPAAEQFDPDVILVSSGFDSHYSDLLGGLHLGIDFFGDIIKQYQDIQSKIVLTIEGGYNLDVIGKCFLSQVGMLCGKPQYFDDTVPSSIKKPDVIKKVKKQLKPYWDI
jgi:acetoin utilization deacetylase AcuC-like enzyme